MIREVRRGSALGVRELQFRNPYHRRGSESFKLSLALKVGCWSQMREFQNRPIELGRVGRSHLRVLGRPYRH